MTGAEAMTVLRQIHAAMLSRARAEAELARLARYRRMTPGMKDDQDVALKRLREAETTLAAFVRNPMEKPGAPHPMYELLWKNDDRYRFLRDRAQYLEGVVPCVLHPDHLKGHAHEILSEDELDEAIDAAIAAHPEE